MDSFEVNKILGAVLGTMTFALGLSIATEIIFEPEKPAKAGYALPEPEPVAPGGVAAAPAVVAPIATRLASADVGKGESLTKQCQSCHTFEKGGANKVGPNLYGIVGRQIGAEAGFGYSAALKKLQAADGKWSFEDLDHWIADPKAMAAGTAMSFAGIKRPDQRADVIAYLNKNSDSPLPLPPPPPADAAAAPGGPKSADAAPGGAAPAPAAAPAAAPGAAASAPATTAAPAAAGTAASAPGPLQQPAQGAPGADATLGTGHPTAGGPAGHEQNSPAQVEQRQGLQSGGAAATPAGGGAGSSSVSPSAKLPDAAPAPPESGSQRPTEGQSGTVPTVPRQEPATPTQAPATGARPDAR